DRCRARSGRAVAAFQWNYHCGARLGYQQAHLALAIGRGRGGCGNCDIFYTHHAGALTSKDEILLADFTNTTGDPVFDGTLKKALAVELGQSPFLSLLGDDRVM